MVAAWRCVRPHLLWYQLAYATEMKSIQLHDSIEGLSQKIVFITLHTGAWVNLVLLTYSVTTVGVGLTSKYHATEYNGSNLKDGDLQHSSALVRSTKEIL